MRAPSPGWGEGQACRVSLCGVAERGMDGEEEVLSLQLRKHPWFLKGPRTDSPWGPFPAPPLMSHLTRALLGSPPYLGGQAGTGAITPSVKALLA